MTLKDVFKKRNKEDTMNIKVNEDPSRFKHVCFVKRENTYVLLSSLQRWESYDKAYYSGNYVEVGRDTLYELLVTVGTRYENKTEIQWINKNQISFPKKDEDII